MFETAGKPITCRAAIAWEANKTLVIETIQVAPPKVGEVRVMLVAAGVSHQTTISGKEIQTTFSQETTALYR